MEFYPILEKRLSLLLIIAIFIANTGFANKINNGILDIRDNDFSSSIALDGEWEFYYNKLLSPLDLKQQQRQYYTFPSTWENVNLNNQSYSSFGYATYRLVIIKDNNTPYLALRIPDMYSAYKMWINGKEFSNNGKVGTTKSTTTPFWLSSTKILNTKSDTVEIVLQIANFRHSKGGISKSIILGEVTSMLHQRELSVTFDVFMTGSIIIAGLFFLGLYFFGQHDKAMFYFALFCVAYCYRVIGYGNQYLHHIFPDYPWLIAIRLEYITMFLSALFFIEFLKYVFPKENNYIVIRVFEITGLILLIFTLVTPPSIFTKAVNIFQLAIAVFSIYALIVIAKAVYNKRVGSINSMLSILCFLFALVGLILEYKNIYVFHDVITFFCYIGFFFFQSLIMSFRFSKQLEQSVDKANEAVKAKSEFLATMSHEIRTPMNGVIGMTSLLADTKLTAEQKSFVETIRISGDNLITIINDILDFSKIESGKMELEKQPFEIEAALESVCDLFSLKAFEKGLGLRCNIDNDIPIIAVGDVTRIKQVILNLVNNAIKFTHNGEVLLKAKKISEQSDKITLQIDITDTGIGIPEEKRSRLFQAFSQVDASHTRKYGGTGLGLAISKKLIELMGGTIWVESIEGLGSTFSFTIELALNKEAYKPIAHLQDFSFVKDKNCLLVSDNARFTRFITLQMQKMGLNVQHLLSHQLLSKNEDFTTEIDLVILDYSVYNQVKEWHLQKYSTLEIVPILALIPPSQHNLHFSKQVHLMNLPFRNITFRHTLKNIFLAKAYEPKVIISIDNSKLYSKYPMRILVAEDHAINQRLVLFLLKKAGFIADAVGNGLEAVEAVQRQKYDLVFMDIQMPELDGLQATRKIHQSLPIENRPIIIAMTANAMHEDKIKCLEAGMDDYISKPLKEGIVYEAIEKWGKIIKDRLELKFV